MQVSSHDIVIIGGGMVGLSLACALAQQTSLSVAVLEAQSDSNLWSETDYHHRVSAFALSSRRIFQHLHVWDKIKQKRISPFSRIYVWDSVKDSEINFDSQSIAEPELGYIIENNLVQSALLERVRQLPQIAYFSSVNLIDVRNVDSRVEVIADHQIFKGKLVVAADGAKSWLRQQLRIDVEKKNYEQEGIVATVHTKEPHQQTAWQVFLSTGPVGFLPLVNENTYSIVWSLPRDEAHHMLALSNEAFKNELSSRIANVPLGVHIESVANRFAFPLQRQQATQYIRPRIALVGDAAHTVHPLAGQGVNMGLLDAASLVDVISDAVAQHRDFASYSTLRRYERWRRADNLPMMVGVDAIKSLFASELTSVQSARSMGLSVTNKLPFLKKIFSRHAVGNRVGLPRLAQQMI